MTTARAGALLVLSAAALCIAACDRLGGENAEAAPAPAPTTPAAPATAPAPAPTPTAPGGATPRGDAGAGQTIELPGLGSITVNLGGGTAAPASGGGAGGGSGTPRTKVPATPPPPDAITPTGGLTMPFMQTETRAIHAALIAALPEAQRSRIAGVRLDIVNEPVEPNAAAACTRGTGQPVMLITTAMIVLAGGIAESRAYDELASTSVYESYAQQVVEQLRGRRAVTGVPAGLITGPMARDPRKLARERQLFQEQIAFIIGHEIAHLHRGHTSCVSSGDASRASAEELARIASSAVPTFTQPLEVEADTWAVYTVLNAGNGRPGGSWDEEGGLINLEFFGRLRDLGGTDILGAFLGTHPPPQLRRPIIEAAARQWSPGQWPPSTPAGGALPIPGGGTLPIRIPGLTTP